MAEVTLYKKAGCRPCEMVLSWLRERKIEPIIKDINIPTHREEIKKLGVMMVPVVVIDGHVIEGWSPVRMKALLGVE